MNIRAIVYLLLVASVFSSCGKKTVSKVPIVGLIYFGPQTPLPQAPNSVRANHDTCTLEFSLSDGDADLGVIQPGQRDIYIKDFRYDTGFVGYLFPSDLDFSIEDPKKGLTGTCIFYFPPFLLTPRIDSLHPTSDTTHMAFYIVDRAGNHSDTVNTGNIIMLR